MYLVDYVSEQLRETPLPLLTETALFVLIKELYMKAKSGSISVSRLPSEFESSQFRRVVSQLVKRRVIAQDAEFKSAIWQNLTMPPAATAEDAFCLVDPFAYVSFLSAMQRHSLTDRSPKSLQIATLADPLWKQSRLEKLEADLPEEMLGPAIPMPHRIGIRKTLRGREIDLHKTRHPLTTTRVRGTFARITTIGCTFVNMLAEPQHCGGMRHVMVQFVKYFPQYSQEIIEAIEDHGTAIVKVRAGYLIEENLQLRPEILDNWIKHAQRGGSRRLDPQKPYGASYSEKWMLATNV